MKIELTEEQQKGLLQIISQATIKGSDAPFVLQVAKALQTPIVDKEVKE